MDPMNVPDKFEVRSFTHSWDNSDWNFEWGLQLANPNLGEDEAVGGSGMVGCPEQLFLYLYAFQRYRRFCAPAPHFPNPTSSRPQISLKKQAGSQWAEVVGSTLSLSCFMAVIVVAVIMVCGRHCRTPIQTSRGTTLLALCLLHRLFFKSVMITERLSVVVAGPGEIISEDPLRLDDWTTVIAERNRNDGSLIVNDATAVKGLLTAYY